MELFQLCCIVAAESAKLLHFEAWSAHLNIAMVRFCNDCDGFKNKSNWKINRVARGSGSNPVVLGVGQQAIPDTLWV